MHSRKITKASFCFLPTHVQEFGTQEYTQYLNTQALKCKLMISYVREVEGFKQNRRCQISAQSSTVVIYLSGYTTSNHFSLAFEAYNSLLLSLHCNSLSFISFVYTKLFCQKWSLQLSVDHSLITLNFVFFLRSFYDMYLSLYYKWELLIHEELSMDAPKSSDFFSLLF